MTETREAIFTELFLNNSWGSRETRSGPAATLERTEQVRRALPDICKELEIQTLLDCGCGDWNWMKHVDLSGVAYMGVDIVEPLITDCQERYTKDTVNFQKLDVIQDPPETADLWLMRDFLCQYSYKDCLTALQKFVESGSQYIAVTTVETMDPYQDCMEGSYRALNLLAAPFILPEPMMEYDDGTQWFRTKKLVVYNRQQIIEWIASKKQTTAVAAPPPWGSGTQGRNAHLVNNVLLRDIKGYGHKV